MNLHNFSHSGKSLLAVLIAGGILNSFPAQAEVVKIAFIEVLSGPFAKTGEGSSKHCDKVALQLNAKAKANDTKYEIVALDGKGSPQESVVALKSAVDQGIHYITQGGGSGVALALSDAISKLTKRGQPTGRGVFELLCHGPRVDKREMQLLALPLLSVERNED